MPLLIGARWLYTDSLRTRHITVQATQHFNLSLTLAPQVKALRSLLAEATAAEAGADLFHSLYSSWSHSAGAVLSLCFLAGAYSHACDVITAYAHLPMGVEVLVQIDRLVQLLETPIFTYLRLQLLQPARYPDLIRCAACCSPCAVLLVSASCDFARILPCALKRAGSW